MGNCKYCGLSAGRFRSLHKDCRLKRLSALGGIRAGATECALGKSSADDLRSQLLQANGSFVSDAEARNLLVVGFENAARVMLEDDWISQESERALEAYANEFGLSISECNRTGTLDRIRMSNTLRQIATGQGDLHDWSARWSSLPFSRKSPNERIVWAFDNVQVAFGSTKRRTSDTGMLVMTNRGLYFAGRSGSHRVSFGRLQTLRREPSGFAIHSGPSAKTYSVNRGVNGWFAWKLVKLLVKMN